MDMLVKVYKAVANEKRLKMLSLLIKHREMLLEDIYSEMEIPQATASRNLKILEKAHFVSTRFMRRKVYYSIVESNKYPYNKVILDSIRRWQKKETS